PPGADIPEKSGKRTADEMAPQGAKSLDEAGGRRGQPRYPAAHRRPGRPSPLRGDLLDRLPESPQVAGDHGRQDGEDRAEGGAQVEADGLDERRLVRRRRPEDPLPKAVGMKRRLSASPAGSHATSVAVGVQEALPVGLQVTDILGDDGAVLDASRQIGPNESNWRQRGRERVSAHGISFAEKKENPYLLRASLRKVGLWWDGPRPGRRGLPPRGGVPLQQRGQGTAAATKSSRGGTIRRPPAKRKRGRRGALSSNRADVIRMLQEGKTAKQI